MFRVDRIEVKGTMQGVQVQLVTGELRTKLGMQIPVKQGRLSARTATCICSFPLAGFDTSESEKPCAAGTGLDTSPELIYLGVRNVGASPVLSCTGAIDHMTI
ncbi:hypothetical protein Tco_0066976 [Tanacetum coccineum]